MRLHEVIYAVFLGSLTSPLCLAGPQPIAEWTFRRPGELQGWQPNGHLTNVMVTNGAVSCRAIGPDPIFEYIPLVNFKASPKQVVEIRLRADRDGTAELFWSNTSTGRYGGFAQEKSTRFNVRGDNAWHTYRLLPCWQREDKIVRLRFDVYDAAGFEWASLRVLELEMPSPAQPNDLEDGINLNTWQWFEPIDAVQQATAYHGGRLKQSEKGFLFGPPVNIAASSNRFVSVRLSVSRGRHGTIFFATDESYGLHGRTFALQANGRDHTYNIDMQSAREWRGRVLALGLQPSNETNAVAVLRQVKAAAAPQGPPELTISSFAVTEALPRVGQPAGLSAFFSNSGGAEATNIRARLIVPPGVKLTHDSATADQVIRQLGPNQQTRLGWKIQTGHPVDTSVRLELRSDNAEITRATAPLRFTPRASVIRTGYVPEPRPVRGAFEVGVYYFPGWNTAKRWEPLQSFPERKPVLGWYREGDPEVADWHIKWAVEHGITFFAYDWYWSQGARQLEHALHEGYFKARYHHLLKFCLLWANHNPPHSSSQTDCIAVTRYWIENYFQRPEHLTFENKPVVIIFAPDRLTEDLGATGVKQALEAMRGECRAAGLKGLYIIACVGEAGGARRAAEQG